MVQANKKIGSLAKQVDLTPGIVQFKKKYTMPNNRSFFKQFLDFF
jgi:hypothetical protein